MLDEKLCGFAKLFGLRPWAGSSTGLDSGRRRAHCAHREGLVVSTRKRIM